MKRSGKFVYKKYVGAYRIFQMGQQHASSCPDLRSDCVVDAASSAKNFLWVVLQLAVPPIWRNQQLKDQVNRHVKRIELFG